MALLLTVEKFSAGNVARSAVLAASAGFLVAGQWSLVRAARTQADVPRGHVRGTLASWVLVAFFWILWLASAASSLD